MKQLKPATKAPLLVLIIYCLLAASSALTFLWGKDENSAYAAAIVIQILIFVLPTLFYSRLTSLSFTKKLNLRLFPPTKIVLILGLLGIMIFGSLTVSLLFGSIVGSVGGNTLSLSTGVSIAGMNPLFVIFAFCIVPAVCEEFVFRGVLLSEYSAYGPTAAVILTSALFAMSHFSFAELPSRFFCGIVLAGALYMTKSIFAPMLLHLANNLVNVYLLPYVNAVVLQPRGALFSVFIVGTLFLACVILVLREGEAVYFEFAYDPAYAGRRDGRAPGKVDSALVAFFSPTFVICLLFFVIRTLVGN